MKHPITPTPSGRSASRSGSRAPHEAAAASSPKASIPSAAVSLTDLSPRHMGDPELGRTPFADDPARLYHEIAFLCPKCRKHEISVAFWGGEPRNAVQVEEADYGPIIKRMWHREGTQGFLDLTLTPSINREGKGDKCGGWHGHITNGLVQ